jgi:hypothetical protein
MNIKCSDSSDYTQHYIDRSWFESPPPDGWCYQQTNLHFHQSQILLQKWIIIVLKKKTSPTTTTSICILFHNRSFIIIVLLKICVCTFKWVWAAKMVGMSNQNQIFNFSNFTSLASYITFFLLVSHVFNVYVYTYSKTICNKTNKVWLPDLRLLNFLIFSRFCTRYEIQKVKRRQWTH